MRSTLTPASLLTLLALAPAVALAHHGWSSYDSSKVLTLTAPFARRATSIPTAS